MKKIEDYLKHYIGCDVMVDLTMRAKMFGVVNGSQPVVQYYDDGESLVHCPEMIKLLLRPLSSMTEEESDSIQEKYFFGSIDFDRDKIKFAINIADRLSKQMDVARYLLSRGFDLFGLIDSNLALDSTKIEKV